MSDTTRSRLKVSREGIVLIKSFEGFRPRAVRNEAGGWVIGYGHTASAREGATVGEQDAELLLQYDLMPVVKALNEDVSVALNQHQFDALASFAASVGVARFLASDVLRRLNAGHAGEAADALIGWPEAAAPDSALRRRAAERALFVADPASPVHLADLLAAPLPPPPVPAAPAAPAPVEPTPAPLEAAESPVVQPDFAAGAAARAAAVASLLGEDPAPVDEAAPQPPPESPIVAAPAAPAPAFSVHAAMRYSPYSAAIIGPLPGFPPATLRPPAEPSSAPEPASVVEATAAAQEADDEPAPPPAPALEPMGEDAAAPAGPAGEPVDLGPLVPPPAAPSPFPPMEALVLTPPVEADFIEAARPVWPAEHRLEPAEDGTEDALFTDEPPLSVLRHEAEPEQPRRFDWSETGAFLIMGGVGLAACAASAAAFRLAVAEPSDMGETAVIAWALALIGAICVGVSSWNLYVRWGRSS